MKNKIGFQYIFIDALIFFGVKIEINANKANLIKTFFSPFTEFLFYSGQTGSSSTQKGGKVF